MKQIQVVDFFSTRLNSSFNSIKTIEVENQPFTEGGFGEIYYCISINNDKVNLPQIIKIFKGSTAELNHNTIQKLQRKLQNKNTELLSIQNKTLLEEFPALLAVPQFSFIGILNGKTVRGFSSNDLKSLGFEEFKEVLENDVLLAKYQSLSIEIKLAIAYRFVSAFKILKECTFVHADIKPEAIFVNTNLNNETCAIIDFDSGVITEKLTDDATTWGTPNEWVAPEIWEQLKNKSSQNQKVKVNLFSDTWSIAVGVHFFLTTCHPLFFLTELSTNAIKQYFNRNQWPQVNRTSKYFNYQYSVVYEKYIRYINDQLPKEVFDQFALTINNGYFSPHLRTTYDKWTTVLQKFKLYEFKTPINVGNRRISPLIQIPKKIINRVPTALPLTKNNLVPQANKFNGWWFILALCLVIILIANLKNKTPYLNNGSADSTKMDSAKMDSAKMIDTARARQPAPIIQPQPVDTNNLSKNSANYSDSVSKNSQIPDYPDKEKIESDLIGKKMQNWKFDYLSEFQDFQIVSNNYLNNYLNMTINLRLKDEGTNRLFKSEIIVNYHLAQQGWEFENINQVTYDEVTSSYTIPRYSQPDTSNTQAEPGFTENISPITKYRPIGRSEVKARLNSSFRNRYSTRNSGIYPNHLFNSSAPTHFDEIIVPFSCHCNFDRNTKLSTNFVGQATIQENIHFIIGENGSVRGDIILKRNATLTVNGVLIGNVFNYGGIVIQNHRIDGRITNFSEDL